MDMEDEYEEMAPFQLTADDVNLLGSQLKSALIPFQQLEIINDLGEGKLFVYRTDAIAVS